ncbi:serine hydrolase [Aminipila luticellarii]|nr:serine hydrolase [Aminipila luticellarii]
MILNKIEDRLESLKGNIGIDYIDLTTGMGCFAGNCDLFPSSGIAKLMVLIEVFNQLESGKLNQEDKYILKKADSEYYKGLQIEEPTYGVLSFLHEGLELNVRDLYNLMITISDNVAFNILLKMVQKDNINQTLRKNGFNDTVINRAFFDWDKINAGIDNYHSVKEVADMFRKLYLGQLISNKASGQMLELLKRHQRTNIIPYYFSEKLSIAHQTGFDENLIHDMGIVLSERPFVLCMSASNVDTRKAESVMRDVALICFNHSKSL